VVARIGRIDPFVEDGPIGVVERAERRFRTPIADRDLLDQAQAAVLTADEKTAKLHGEHQADRLREERKRVKEQNRERFRELETGEYVTRWWKGAWHLWPTHESVWVSDRGALDGADTATLRAHMRAMREAGQIPEGVRRDVFLLVDKGVLCHEEFVNTTPISASHKRDTIRLRAVDPDHDPTAQLIPTEGPYAGFDGEVAVPLPKVFDWLYYTFFAGTEPWLVRYRQTKAERKEGEGVAPQHQNTKGVPWWVKPIMPYPRYEF
jgi:hypothetical protein